MDPAKVEFLFERVPEGLDLDDLDDPDDIADLVALDDDEPASAARSAMRAIVAQQILSDDPPAVWATAQRLLALGVDRSRIMGELVLALLHTAQNTLADEKEGLDTDAYEAALASLPLPLPADIEAAALAIVAGGGLVSSDDLDARVLDRVGRPATDALAVIVADRVLDRLMDDEGPIALLAGDRVVHVGALTAGIVLTHRLSPAERDLDVLPVDFDLAGFGRRDLPRLADGTELLTVDLDDAGLAWQGPPGWLSVYEAGALLAVRADAGVVTLGVVAEEPALNADLVGLVRRVYDEEVAEPWLPVPGEDLILGALAAAGDAFAHPQPPLDDLCAAAGLDRRGAYVAHDDDVWAAELALARVHRVYYALDTEAERRAAMDVLDAAESEDPSPEDLRRALGELGDAGVAEVVLAELVADGRAEPFSEALVAAAATSRQTGVARWVAAIVAERAGDVELAEAHLHLGLEADPSSGVLVERCAWYASDRGRAREALALWHRLGDRRAADIATVEPFARRSGPKLGRNDPCWCGSGRKYKSCHPGQQPVTPLTDRVGWLCRKATAYLEHGGAEARDLVMALAHCRATGADDDSVLEALEDPIVVDAALTEGGWFGRFVEDRSPLLPEDEALLAQSWLLVSRSVYEVVEVSAGAGVRARDLGTGEVVDVRERTFSREVRPGTLVCARAVPDGEGYQFVGGLFPVAPGTEGAVLELCEAEDAVALCEHVGSTHRPPELRTREGEPLVACTAVLEVPDPVVAARVLDVHYRRDGEAWVEMFAIGEDEDILRATLAIEGDRLQVQAHSERRIERVLGVLAEVLPDARLSSDLRSPLAPGELPTPPTRLAGDVTSGPEALAQIQELFERRWLDESVPALAGLTPRQAAADPTRRDELLRLIASFPSPEGLPEGAVSMRPTRLRALLDL